MELKDIILSTLAELEEPAKEQVNTPTHEDLPVKQTKSTVKTDEDYKEEIEEKDDSGFDPNLVFLQNTRERILVLFEGFQSPNNKNIEAKVDLTLNFLEYLLASIDEHLEKAKKPLLP